MISRDKFIRYLETVDYLYVGNISADWNTILDECYALVDKSPTYWNSVCAEGLKDWGGVQGAEKWTVTTDGAAAVGYTSQNTKSWGTTHDKPQLHMEWEKIVKDWLPLEHAISRPSLQKPGNVLPWHRDYFVMFKKHYPEESEYVIRFIVFMKDWEPGHMFNAGDSIFSNWKAGDAIVYHPTRYHIGANAGMTDKWTQNVTGVLKEQINFPALDLGKIC
jgi:hypothetical protein